MHIDECLRIITETHCKLLRERNALKAENDELRKQRDQQTKYADTAYETDQEARDRVRTLGGEFRAAKARIADLEGQRTVLFERIENLKRSKEHILEQSAKAHWADNATRAEHDKMQAAAGRLRDLCGGDPSLSFEGILKLAGDRQNELAEARSQIAAMTKNSGELRAQFARIHDATGLSTITASPDEVVKFVVKVLGDWRRGAGGKAAPAGCATSMSTVNLRDMGQSQAWNRGCSATDTAKVSLADPPPTKVAADMTRTEKVKAILAITDALDIRKNMLGNITMSGVRTEILVDTATLISKFGCAATVEGALDAYWRKLTEGSPRVAVGVWGEKRGCVYQWLDGHGWVNLGPMP